MITYREELEKNDAYLENGKLIQSANALSLFEFLYFIKIKTNKKDGYIDFMSRGKDAGTMSDLIMVTYDIVLDVKDIIDLTKDQKVTFIKLEEVLELIIKNVDKVIKINPMIIYDDDDDDERLQGNLLHKLDNLINPDLYT
jgi:hypothetical protein